MFNIGEKKIEIIVREAKPCINIITKEKKRSICIMKCVITEKGMLIGDIIDLEYPKHIDKGYGSKMMITLLQFCSQHNIDYLYGILSTVDEGHKDRLIHFYEKFGFNLYYMIKPLIVNLGI